MANTYELLCVGLERLPVAGVELLVAVGPVGLDRLRRRFSLGGAGVRDLHLVQNNETSHLKVLLVQLGGLSPNRYS